MRRLPQRAALAVSLALVLGVTLRPAAGPNDVALAPWATQQLDPVNVVGNVALFALPSAVLWFFGWSFRRTVVSGLMLSLGIELLQLAVPGRTTATADVVCNTLGAAAGWLLARKYWGHGRTDDVVGRMNSSGMDADDRPPICARCGVTMVPAALSAADDAEGDWVCLECEELDEAE